MGITLILKDPTVYSMTYELCIRCLLKMLLHELMFLNNNHHNAFQLMMSFAVVHLTVQPLGTPIVLLFSMLVLLAPHVYICVNVLIVCQGSVCTPAVLLEQFSLTFPYCLVASP